MDLNLNKWLAEIRGKVNPESLTDSCSGEGCTVHLVDIPSERIVIDVEKEFDSRRKNEKRCDRLLFYGNTAKNTFVAVPIELKSGKATESDVREKLVNSVRFAATIAPDRKKNGKTVYVPVLVCGRRIEWTNPRDPKNRQEFKAGNHLILIERCGRERNLARALSEAGHL